MLPGEFSDRIQSLIARDDLDDHLERNEADGVALAHSCARLVEAAFVRREPTALYEAQKALYFLYEDSLKPAGSNAGHNQFNPYLIGLRNRLERGWEKFELARIGTLPEDVPADPDAFREYFVRSCWAHKMIGHPLFQFLRDEATRGDLISFFVSDAAVIIRFCDLVVLSMVGVDDDVRPELANNFWDEMGQGRFQDRHVELYRDLLEYAGLNLPSDRLSTEHFIEHLDWPGLTGYNLYLFLCLHRRNQFRSLGALGAAEMTDPPQYANVLTGCRRVGLDDDSRLAYYAGHTEMDVAHGDAWLENVLLPLVRRYPERRHEIVIGAQMRMNVTKDYYDDLLDTLRRGSPGRATGG